MKKTVNRPSVQAVVLRRKLRAYRTEYNRIARKAIRIERRRQRIMQCSLEICRILDAMYYAPRDGSQDTDHADVGTPNRKGIL